MRESRIRNENDPIDVLVPVKNGAESPLYNIYDKFNDVDQFAIMRTTDNGKYVRGGMLYFQLNGVTIYTDINNIIFVNRKDNSIIVREDTSISEQIAPVNPENKQYIILLNIDDEVFEWRAMEGRTTIYEYIKENIEILGFDPDTSIILTDTVPFKDASTVTQFIKYLQNGNLVEEDGFDIDDYHTGD